MWEEYGNELLFPYYRNNDTSVIRNDEDTADTAPFNWDTNSEEAVHSFMQCYEEHLINYEVKLNDHNSE